VVWAAPSTVHSMQPLTEARGQGRACGASLSSTELLRELTLN